jgi:drug/metabolite transporter superfamily protein YnfA
VRLKSVRYLTFFLAACVIVNDGLYLFYLNSGHHMVRYWSGTSSALLGLFIVSLSMLMRAKGGRWVAAMFLVIGLLNLGVGFLFFL